jgi:ethanolamine transporter EutH
MAGNPEEDKFWLKISIYILGTVLGVASKLAVMHRTKSINLKDVIINTIVAFSAAWVVYAALVATGRESYATLASVLCGRFADDIFQIVWKWFKTMIGQVNKDLN